LSYFCSVKCFLVFVIKLIYIEKEGRNFAGYGQ